MEILPVVSLVGGAVLMYGAVKNKNPIGTITAALTGQDLATVPPLMGAPGGGPLDPKILGPNTTGSAGGTTTLKDPGNVGRSALGINSQTIAQGRPGPVGSGNGAV